MDGLRKLRQSLDLFKNDHEALVKDIAFCSCALVRGRGA